MNSDNTRDQAYIAAPHTRGNVNLGAHQIPRRDLASKARACPFRMLRSNVAAIAVPGNAAKGFKPGVLVLVPEYLYSSAPPGSFGKIVSPGAINIGFVGKRRVTSNGSFTAAEFPECLPNTQEARVTFIIFSISCNVCT